MNLTTVTMEQDKLFQPLLRFNIKMSSSQVQYLEDLLDGMELYGEILVGVMDQAGHMDPLMEDTAHTMADGHTVQVTEVASELLTFGDYIKIHLTPRC